MWSMMNGEVGGGGGEHKGLDIPPGVPQEVPRRFSMWALISLLTGSAALVVDGMGPFIGVAAVLAGHVALYEIREKRSEVIYGKMVARTGLVAGYLGMFMAVSLVWSEMTSRTDICQQRLQNLGIACIRYLADHDNHQLPPDFVTLVREKYVENYDLFVCPEAGHAVPHTEKELKLVQDRDYIFVAGGLSREQLKKAPEKTLMIIERPGHHYAGIIHVIYCDGHVERRRNVHFKPPSPKPPTPPTPPAPGS